METPVWGGLMEKWSEDFYDPLYSLTGGDVKSLAKHQEEVSMKTRMPIDASFWLENPPSSTHPKTKKNLLDALDFGEYC